MYMIVPFGIYLKLLQYTDIKHLFENNCARMAISWRFRNAHVLVTRLVEFPLIKHKNLLLMVNLTSASAPVGTSASANQGACSVFDAPAAIAVIKK